MLQDINYRLCCEDQTLRTFRRTAGFSKSIKNHLLPLLINAKDDVVNEINLRILVNITLPVECLYQVDIMQRTDAGRLAVSDCERLLSDCKELFANNRTLKSIVDYLKNVLEKNSNLSTNQCESVNNCLLLIRNILHIPEKNYFINNNNNNNNSNVNQTVNNNNNNCIGGGGKTYNETQNEIVWHLFSLNIDKLLIYLMSCAQRSSFGISVVQLIALLYKDQHVSNLQKLLNSWYETSSLSDSSGDFESNTTATKRCSQDSSPMLTSDSSDNNGG